MSDISLTVVIIGGLIQLVFGIIALILAGQLMDDFEGVVIFFATASLIPVLGKGVIYQFVAAVI